ncbi:hypothetical protein N7512_008584 [Penicillium capsulatum]|nr:hypothetical protein N7512_008584 [Penicillium capsulatum]
MTSKLGTVCAILTYFIFALFAPVFSLPTDLAPTADLARRDSPSPPSLEVALSHETAYVLPSDDTKRRCLTVPWRKDGVTLSFDNTKGSLAIMIQTSSGALICFVSAEELDAMWNSKSSVPIRLGKQFREPFLGQGGRITDSLDQLRKRQNQALKVENDDCSSFQALADLLKKDILGTGDNQAADIPIYPLIHTPAGKCAIYLPSIGSQESQEFQEYKAHIYISGLSNQKEHGGHIGEISMSKVDTYPKADNADLSKYAVFEEGELKYSVTPDADTTLIDEIRKNPKAYAQAHETIDFQSHTEPCKQVLWSPGGSLLEYLNTDMSTVLTIQTSAGMIMCYVPQRDWSDAFKDWTQGNKRKGSAYSGFDLSRNEVQRALVKPLARILRDQCTKSNTKLRILRSQLWMTAGSSSTKDTDGPKTSAFLADVKDHLKGTFQTIINEQKGILAESDYTLESDVKLRSHINDNIRLSSDAAWIGLWQKAPGPGDDVGAKTTKASMWRMNPSTKTSPFLDMELSKLSLVSKNNLKVGQIKYTQHKDKDKD